MIFENPHLEQIHYKPIICVSGDGGFDERLCLSDQCILAVMTLEHNEFRNLFNRRANTSCLVANYWV